MTVKRKALGRGLAALIPTAAGGGSPAASAFAAPESAADLEAGPARGGREGLRTIAIEDIHPSRDQPRKMFDDARLAELAESIRSQGIIQPLVVRVREGGGGYELIAGERRWRAAQRAGLHDLPAIVREVASDRAFEMALVENLQREDLNPIEEAEGYQRLIKEHGYTQESLAGRVGKDRTTVTNALRLLRLPESVRALVVGGTLAMGHARALLGLESTQAIERVGRRIAARDMSVRQVEALVRRERAGGDAAQGDREAGGAAAAASIAVNGSAAARDLAARLQRGLQTRVNVVETAPGRGHLEIHYHSLDELDALLARLLP